MTNGERFNSISHLVGAPLALAGAVVLVGGNLGNLGVRPGIWQFLILSFAFTYNFADS